jgi:hypothetical protein
MLRRLLPIAFDGDVLKYVFLPYMLPFLVRGLGIVTGIDLLNDVWIWLFLPAVGLHLLLALHVAGKVEGTEREADYLRSPRSSDKLAEDLAKGFKAVGSRDGYNAVRELVYEYEQLQPILERRKATDSFSVSHIPALTVETYKQGMSVLQDALDLTRAVDAEGQRRLEQEIHDLEEEILRLRQIAGEAARVRIREDRLASDRELLELMKEKHVRIDELLYQADRCTVSLQRARMELAALRAGDSEAGVNGVTETLRLTINHAKGVQDEMRKLGA